MQLPRARRAARHAASTPPASRSRTCRSRPGRSLRFLWSLDADRRRSSTIPAATTVTSRDRRVRGLGRSDRSRGTVWGDYDLVFEPPTSAASPNWSSTTSRSRAVPRQPSGRRSARSTSRTRRHPRPDRRRLTAIPSRAARAAASSGCRDRRSLLCMRGHARPASCPIDGQRPGPRRVRRHRRRAPDPAPLSLVLDPGGLAPIRFAQLRLHDDDGSLKSRAREDEDVRSASSASVTPRRAATSDVAWFLRIPAPRSDQRSDWMISETNQLQGFCKMTNDTTPTETVWRTPAAARGDHDCDHRTASDHRDRCSRARRAEAAELRRPGPAPRRQARARRHGLLRADAGADRRVQARSARARTCWSSRAPAPARRPRSVCRSSTSMVPTHRQPQALILAPTRELALQVARELTQHRQAPRHRRSSRSTAARRSASRSRALRDGVHIVVGTPGRVLDHIGRRTLDCKHDLDVRPRRVRRDAVDGLPRGHRARRRRTCPRSSRRCCSRRRCPTRSRATRAAT